LKAFCGITGRIVGGKQFLSGVGTPHLLRKAD
jgi:hypothetical protein